MPQDPTLPSFRGRLTPFRALRFAPENISDLADLVVPPRASLYLGSEVDEASGPPTVKRLFPHPARMDSDQWDPRDRSEISLSYQVWRDQGHLQWDEAAGFYAHRLSFTGPHGEPLERTGFYAVIAIDAQGGVRLLPHEQTLPDRVRRQVEIFTWRGAQVLPLFVLYCDPLGEVFSKLGPAMSQTPTLAFKDSLGQGNALWQVSDPDVIASIQRWFEGRELVLADGHHRFEAARAYWRELRQQGEDKTQGLRDEDLGAEAYAVTYLTPAEAPGLMMGTFHRGARLVHRGAVDLSHQLGSEYIVEHLPLSPGVEWARAIDAELTQQQARRQSETTRPSRFVAMVHGQDGLYLLTRRVPVAATAPPTERLDVSDVHNTLLPSLGESEAVVFQQDIQSLVEAVRSGEFDVGLFLLPPTTEEVWEVARSRVPMPPKATYFFPKLPAGLLHFPLEHLLYKTSGG